MQASKKRISDLINKYLREGLSETDQAELLEWRKQSSENESSFIEMTDPENLVASLTLYDQAELRKEAGLIKVLTPASPQESKTPKIWRIPRRPFIAVASVLLIASTSTILLYKHSIKNQAPKMISNVAYKNDVLPGGDKAVLTLGDGTKIVLDKAQNGALTQQGNTKVLKLDAGRIIYNVTHNNIIHEKPEIIYNTITTPKGGQYQITLPDGSKAWLNNASSLKFPVKFEKNSRTVELKGEAYFEVSPNKHKPFSVLIGQETVEVLGTHFNVKAYSDETQHRMTLLEGAIRVRKGEEEKILSPGQQAVLNAQMTAIRVTSGVDVQGAIAWKEGLFHFEGVDIHEVMQQLARWYDIDIIYQGTITDHQFSGDIQRSLPLSNVLRDLGGNGVKFVLEGRQLTVSR